MRTKRIIFSCLILLCSYRLFSEQADLLSFSLAPGVYIPFGDSATYFDFGPTVGFTAEYRLPFAPLLGLRAELGYDLVSILSLAEDVVHVASAGGGVGVNFFPWRFLKASVFGTGGYYYPIVTDPAIESLGNLYLTGGIGLHFLPVRSLSVGVLAMYRKYFDFYDSIALCIGASLIPLRVRQLEIRNIEFDRVFPVLFKYYNTRPIGRAVLENNGSVPIEDISVTLFVEGYMDNPKQCPAPSALKPGAKQEIDLYALFSQKVLAITEDTMVSARISLEYTQKGKKQTRTQSETLRLYNRNAITWDDDRKAAAYVTTRDPGILQFSKNLLSWTKSTVSRAINPQLSAAMGIHEALKISGITYAIDPRTPFIEFSKDKMAVDFLQFPIQTLSYKAGDCDDLSILYSACLESIGVKTAFITIPGHIYMAFSLDMPPERAEKQFLNPDDFIFRDGDTWIPLEITLVQENFLQAWRTGAAEWRENEAKGSAQFYPMSESWQVFESVGFIGEKSEASLPAKSEFIQALTKDMDEFISREIGPRIVQLEQQISQSTNSEKYINRIGVLFARYGLFEKARVQFNKILAKKEYTPALINMGNIFFFEEEFETALKYYDRAYQISTKNSKVLLQLARTHYALRAYSTANQRFAELRKIKPELAEDFTYLEFKSDEAGRATAHGMMEEIPWEEE